MKIKILYLLILTIVSLLASAVDVEAQPSDQAIIAKIRSNYNDPSTIVSVTLSQGGGRTVREVDDGALVDNYYRSYETRERTKYPGVTRIYNGSVKYRKSGGSYSFRNFLVGDWYYEGIPNPPAAELLELIRANLSEYLGPDYNDIIGDLGEVTLAADPDWRWEKLNSLSFNTVVTYTLKVGYRDVETRRVVKRVSIMRSADGGRYDPEAELLLNGRWLPIQRPFVSEKSHETLARRTLSEAEVASTRTLDETERERTARQMLAALPELTVPEFQSANHVIQFTHELLIEGDRDKVTACLHRMLQPYFFEEWSEVALNGNGRDLIESVLAGLAEYKTAFSRHPQIKHQQEGQVEFYDRALRSFNRIAVAKVDGRWRINAVEFSAPAPGTAEHAALVQAGESNSGEPLDVAAPKVLEKFAVGDAIEAHLSGAWHRGRVARIDDVTPDRYFLEFDEIRSMWVTATVMRWVAAASTSARPAVPPSSASPASTALAVGDRVRVNWNGRGRWFPGRIVAIQGDRYQILYDDGDRETTTAEKIRRP
jgi:hypothetical protein